MYSGPTARLDIINFLPTHLIFRPLTVMFLAIVVIFAGAELATVAADFLAGVFGTTSAVTTSTPFILLFQCLATFLGYEFGNYAWHRAEHEVPILWRIHRVHNSAEQLNYFTTVRDHPFEILTMTIAKSLGTALFLGVTLHCTGTSLLPQTAVTMTLVSICFFGFYQSLSHSHMPISFGPALNVLIGGPVLHQIHHSAERHMMNVNSGMETNLYAWIFRTLYLPKRGEDYRWGLNDAEYGTSNPHLSTYSFYIQPLREMFSMIKSSVKNQ